MRRGNGVFRRREAVTRVADNEAFASSPCPPAQPLHSERKPFVASARITGRSTMLPGRRLVERIRKTRSQPAAPWRIVDRSPSSGGQWVKSAFQHSPMVRLSAGSRNGSRTRNVQFLRLVLYPVELSEADEAPLETMIGTCST